MTAKKKRAPRDNPLRGIARAIDSAGRDADLARKNAGNPEFIRKVQADRRGTLSSFRTVQDALADRERIEKAKAAKKKTP